jgi:hypothetical protein
MTKAKWESQTVVLMSGELAMKLAIATSIAVLLSAGSALAGAGAPVPEKPEGGPPSKRPGAVLDADKRKALTEREGDTLSQDKAAPFIVNFEMVDTSKDGKISQEEFNYGCAKGLVQEQASKPSPWTRHSQMAREPALRLTKARALPDTITAFSPTNVR